MKKLWVIPVLAAAVCMGATGCSDTDKGKVDQKGANVFPVSTVDEGIAVAMGDVMPFYDDGVMNIYHLQDSGSSPFYHPIARITTSDFVHYNDEGVALNFEKDVKSNDAALGTGSFIKDANGKYHCFYTGHAASLDDVAPDPLEVIRHATSDDQKTWTKDKNFKIKGDKEGDDAYLNNDFRDPYVYYDSVDSCYYMLVTTRDKFDGIETGVIKYYASTTLDASADGWEDKGIFYRNEEGSYNMECPSVVRFGDYYYLAYSEQGDNRVTHYRYKAAQDKSSHAGEWKKFERDSIDAGGFYAGRLEKAGEKLYAFAWCARLTGGSSGEFDWGGNLVTHELVQKENGELNAVMPKTYKDFFSHQKNYNSVNGDKVEGYTFDGEKFTAHGVQKLSDNVVRISLNIEANGDKGDFGLSFGLDGDYNNRLGSAIIAFELEKNRVTCYNGVSSILRYGAPLTSVAFNFEKDKAYGADIIIDGEILTVYLDGEVALTARITDMKQSNFAFYSNGAKCKIRDIKFYE
ncbi:MAG: hypothetical protein K2N23_02720 [Clostridia bacterium]|nr:hypothetical protein [Clostridia bacterium]